MATANSSAYQPRLQRNVHAVDSLFQRAAARASSLSVTANSAPSGTLQPTLKLDHQNLIQAQPSLLLQASLDQFRSNLQKIETDAIASPAIPSSDNVDIHTAKAFKRPNVNESSVLMAAILPVAADQKIITNRTKPAAQSFAMSRARRPILSEAEKPDASFSPVKPKKKRQTSIVKENGLEVDRQDILSNRQISNRASGQLQQDHRPLTKISQKSSSILTPDYQTLEHNLISLESLQEKMQHLNNTLLNNHQNILDDQTTTIKRQAMRHIEFLQELNEKHTEWQTVQLKRMTQVLETVLPQANQYPLSHIDSELLTPTVIPPLTNKVDHKFTDTTNIQNILKNPSTLTHVPPLPMSQTTIVEPITAPVIQTAQLSSFPLSGSVSTHSLRTDRHRVSDNLPRYIWQEPSFVRQLASTQVRHSLGGAFDYKSIMRTISEINQKGVSAMQDLQLNAPMTTVKTFDTFRNEDNVYKSQKSESPTKVTMSLLPSRKHIVHTQTPDESHQLNTYVSKLEPNARPQDSHPQPVNSIPLRSQSRSRSRSASPSVSLYQPRSRSASPTRSNYTHSDQTSAPTLKPPNKFYNVRLSQNPIFLRRTSIRPPYLKAFPSTPIPALQPILVKRIVREVRTSRKSSLPRPAPNNVTKVEIATNTTPPRQTTATATITEIETPPIHPVIRLTQTQEAFTSTLPTPSPKTPVVKHDVALSTMIPTLVTAESRGMQTAEMVKPTASQATSTERYVHTPPSKLPTPIPLRIDKSHQTQPTHTIRAMQTVETSPLEYEVPRKTMHSSGVQTTKINPTQPPVYRSSVLTQTVFREAMISPSLPQKTFSHMYTETVPSTPPPLPIQQEKTTVAINSAMQTMPLMENHATQVTPDKPIATIVQKVLSDKAVQHTIPRNTQMKNPLPAPRPIVIPDPPPSPVFIPLPPTVVSTRDFTTQSTDNGDQEQNLLRWMQHEVMLRLLVDERNKQARRLILESVIDQLLSDATLVQTQTIIYETLQKYRKVVTVPPTQHSTPKSSHAPTPFLLSIPSTPNEPPPSNQSVESSILPELLTTPSVSSISIPITTIIETKHEGTQYSLSPISEKMSSVSVAMEIVQETKVIPEEDRIVLFFEDPPSPFSKPSPPLPIHKSISVQSLMFTPITKQSVVVQSESSASPSPVIESIELPIIRDMIALTPPIDNVLPDQLSKVISETSSAITANTTSSLSTLLSEGELATVLLSAGEIMNMSRLATLLPTMILQEDVSHDSIILDLSNMRTRFPDASQGKQTDAIEQEKMNREERKREMKKSILERLRKTNSPKEESPDSYSIVTTSTCSTSFSVGEMSNVTEECSFGQVNATRMSKGEIEPVNKSFIAMTVEKDKGTFTINMDQTISPGQTLMLDRETFTNFKLMERFTSLGEISYPLSNNLTRKFQQKLVKEESDDTSTSITPSINDMSNSMNQLFKHQQPLNKEKVVESIVQEVSPIKSNESFFDKNSSHDNSIVDKLLDEEEDSEKGISFVSYHVTSGGDQSANQVLPVFTRHVSLGSVMEEEDHHTSMLIELSDVKYEDPKTLLSVISRLSSRSMSPNASHSSVVSTASSILLDRVMNEQSSTSSQVTDSKALSQSLHVVEAIEVLSKQSSILSLR